MAQISYEIAQNLTENKSDIGFFSLKNDGDEAIVRFPYRSTEDFEILSVHTIKVNNTDRKISCLRNPHDPISACPLCANGKKYAGRFGEVDESAIQNKFFVKMLQYIRNADGTVTAQPVIWERPIGFAKELGNLMKEYGPLNECVFKLVRTGTGTSTRYTIMFGNPNVYRNDIYVNDTSAFDNYTALGRIVLNKTVAEINQYMITGDFPQTNNNNAQLAQHQQYATASNTVSTSQTFAQASEAVNSYAPDDVPFYDSSAQHTDSAPWETTPVMDRPRRY